jgi:hypothetical protein
MRAIPILLCEIFGLTMHALLGPHPENVLAYSHLRKLFGSIRFELGPSDVSRKLWHWPTVT